MTFDPTAPIRITREPEHEDSLKVLNEFANKIAEAVPAGSETPTYYIGASTSGPLQRVDSAERLARYVDQIGLDANYQRRWFYDTAVREGWILPGRARQSWYRQRLGSGIGNRALNALIWGLPDPLVVSLKTAYLGRAIADAVAAQAEPVETMRALRLETNKNLVYRWWRRSPHPEVRNYAKQRYMELHK